MKSFDEYIDGEWVVYINESHPWHLMQFQVYKSKYTHNAFRLKYGDREVVADILEIRSASETNNLLRGQIENSNRDLPRGFRQSGIYGIDDSRFKK